MAKMKDPECQDEVKNNLNDTTGVVIAKYKSLDGIQYLDVRGFDDKIYYHTPMINWTVVKACDE